MNNKIKTGMPLSPETIESRYQKALKQITKLIGINTELKDEATRLQDFAAEIQEQLNIVNEQNKQLITDTNELRKQVEDLESDKATLMKENEDLRKKITAKKEKGASAVDTNSRKRDQMDSHAQVERLSEDLRAMVELERMLNNKEEVIRELSKKANRIDNEYGISNHSETAITNPSNKDLLKKLALANQYIEKINTENVNLRAKLFKAEGTQKLLNAKSVDAFNKYTPEISPRSDILERQTRNSQQVLKRYHHLEAENKKLVKRNESLKSEEKLINDENVHLKKENNKYATQVVGYEALIERQQKIIEELHAQHQSDIKNMTEQFKQKLLEQRESFSPAKSADHLKTIETLQQENRTLKKRLQLFQIELQKYVRTLQAYKQKLTECQKDVDQLMNERKQLIDQLTKLQSSHREKSSYSRGSASRILGAAGNGSGGVDLDRRNSMGETGHFNYP